jgi:hypothetical protein
MKISSSPRGQSPPCRFARRFDVEHCAIGSMRDPEGAATAEKIAPRYNSRGYNGVRRRGEAALDALHALDESIMRDPSGRPSPECGARVPARGSMFRRSWSRSAVGFAAKIQAALEDGAQVLQDGCCLLGSGSMRSGSRGSTRCATSCQRDLAPVVFLSLYQVLGLGINMQAIGFGCWSLAQARRTGNAPDSVGDRRRYRAGAKRAAARLTNRRWRRSASPPATTPSRAGSVSSRRRPQEFLIRRLSDGEGRNISPSSARFVRGQGIGGTHASIRGFCAQPISAHEGHSRSFLGG